MTILYEPSRQVAQHFAMLVGGDVRTAGSLGEAHALLEEDPDEQLILFGPNTPVLEAVGFAAKFRLSRPSLGVVLLRHQLEVGVLADAIRSGVREVADVNDPTSILAACARSQDLSRRLSLGGGRAQGGEPTADGKVVTVYSAKGGCGKTMIATNLAITLAAGGAKKVCLIDLDLTLGDVALMLQLQPERTIADAVPVADRIDETGLRTMVSPYCPGVDALLAPVVPTVAEQINRELITEILYLARSMYDYVIVDTPPIFNDHVLAALDSSHLYLLVATPAVTAMKNLRILLDTFDVLDYRKENRLVVLNRADPRLGVTPADIERVLRIPITSHIPVSRDVFVSINRGVPIVLDSPTHPVSEAIRQLATKRIGAEPTTPKGLKSLMSRRTKR
ncbi:P-loop NTPase [Micromonospora sp. CPCC 205371]|nr:P-loop NTPase [Micromonospora sp. CPCC 205371]